MSKLVFRLKDVPLDEAEAVRTLLQNNQIAFYETDAGNWGISLAGIWVSDDAQAATARKLIDEYQQSHHLPGQSVEIPSLVETLRQQPVKFILTVIFIVVVLYFSIKPFLGFGN